MYIIYPTLLHKQYVTQSQFFNWNLMNLNLEFSFYIGCYTKIKELSLPYYLSIARRRIAGCIPYPSVSVQYKMYIASSRIWTWITVSFSYDNSHNITNAANIYIYIYILYLPTPSTWAGYDTRLIFKQSLTGLNSEFSFS